MEGERSRRNCSGPSAIVTTHTALSETRAAATIARESRSSSGIQAARWHDVASAYAVATVGADRASASRWRGTEPSGASQSD